MEKEDQQNEECIELISEMSDVLEYTFDVDKFISLDRLKTAVEDMRKTIMETVEYIRERGKRSMTSTSCNPMTPLVLLIF